jgi:PEP-CTERM motif
MKSKINCRETKLLFILATAGLVGLFSAVQRCQSQTIYTIGDSGDWSGSELTGFGVSGAADETVGETFAVNNVSALVDSISLPVYSPASTEFQLGVAAWNGSQATGSLLYLSAPFVGTGTFWQTCTVTPNDLILNKGQQYILFLTPNNYVNSSPTYSAGVGAVPAEYYSAGQYFDLVGYELNVDDLFTQSWSAVPASMAFTINYQAAPVPEPSTLTLFFLGGLALFLRCRVIPKIFTAARR